MKKIEIIKELDWVNTVLCMNPEEYRTFIAIYYDMGVRMESVISVSLSKNNETDGMISYLKEKLIRRINDENSKDYSKIIKTLDELNKIFDMKNEEYKEFIGNEYDKSYKMSVYLRKVIDVNDRVRKLRSEIIKNFNSEEYKEYIEYLEDKENIAYLEKKENLNKQKESEYIKYLKEKKN